MASDLQQMMECGLLPYWTIDSLAGKDGGVGADLWSSAVFDRAVYDSFSGSAEEDSAWERYLQTYVPLNTGSYGLLTRGLYELQLRPWFRAFDPSDFMVLKLEALTADNNSTARTLRQVWDHLDVPPIGTVTDTTPKNARDYLPVMTTATKTFLQRFYEPHNQRHQHTLQSTQPRLRESGLLLRHWSESWDYS